MQKWLFVIKEQTRIFYTELMQYLPSSNVNALVSFWHFLFYVTSCITNELIINNKCPKILKMVMKWSGFSVSSRLEGKEEWKMKIFGAIGGVWSSGEKRCKGGKRGAGEWEKKKKNKCFKKSMSNITERLYNNLWLGRTCEAKKLFK